MRIALRRSTSAATSVDKNQAQEQLDKMIEELAFDVAL